MGVVATAAVSNTTVHKIPQVSPSLVPHLRRQLCRSHSCTLHHQPIIRRDLHNGSRRGVRHLPALSSGCQDLYNHFLEEILQKYKDALHPVTGETLMATDGPRWRAVLGSKELDTTLRKTLLRQRTHTILPWMTRPESLTDFLTDRQMFQLVVWQDLRADLRARSGSIPHFDALASRLRSLISESDKLAVSRKRALESSEMRYRWCFNRKEPCLS